MTRRDCRTLVKYLPLLRMIKQRLVKYLPMFQWVLPDAIPACKWSGFPATALKRDVTGRDCRGRSQAQSFVDLMRKVLDYLKERLRTTQVPFCIHVGRARYKLLDASVLI